MTFLLQWTFKIIFKISSIEIWTKIIQVSKFSESISRISSKSLFRWSRKCIKISFESITLNFWISPWWILKIKYSKFISEKFEPYLEKYWRVLKWLICSSHTILYFTTSMKRSLSYLFESSSCSFKILRHRIFYNDAADITIFFLKI